MPFYLHQLSIGLSSGEWLEHRLGALLNNTHLIETVFDSTQAERVCLRLQAQARKQHVSAKKPVLSVVGRGGVRSTGGAAQNISTVLLTTLSRSIRDERMQ